MQNRIQNFQKSVLLPYICEEKNECMDMMSMKLFTKPVKLMAPGSGVQALGWGQYGHMWNIEKVNMTSE